MLGYGMVKCHLDVGYTIPECNILNANKCTRQMARFNFSMDFSWLVAMCSESASSIFKSKISKRSVCFRVVLPLLYFPCMP